MPIYESTPEPRERRVEHRNLLGRVTSVALAARVEIVPAGGSRRSNRLDQVHDLAGSDGHPGIAQIAAEGQQIAAIRRDRTRERRSSWPSASHDQFHLRWLHCSARATNGSAQCRRARLSTSSWYLRITPSVSSTDFVGQLGACPAPASALRPVERLGHARRLEQIDLAQPLGEGANLGRQLLGRLWHLGR